MTDEILSMTLQERMRILSLASKSAEMLEGDGPPTMIDVKQWKALAKDVRPILARLDHDWPAMLPLPHDGVRWTERWVK